jgi:hypothetical protein
LDFPPYSNNPSGGDGTGLDKNLSTASKSPESLDPETLSTKVTEAERRKIELEEKLRLLALEKDSLKDAQQRRQELDSGRAEITRELTRGIELLDTALFDTRARVEQMDIAVNSMKSSLAKIKSIQTSEWTNAEFQDRLTQSLAQLEQCRSDWEETKLKFSSTLAPKSGSRPGSLDSSAPSGSSTGSFLSGEGLSYNELCKIGLALTWPVAIAFLMAFTALVILLIQGRAG